MPRKTEARALPSPGVWGCPRPPRRLPLVTAAEGPEWREGPRPLPRLRPAGARAPLADAPLRTAAPSAPRRLPAAGAAPSTPWPSALAGAAHGPVAAGPAARGRPVGRVCLGVPHTGCSSPGPGRGGRRPAVQPPGERRARKASAPWGPRVACCTHASRPQERSFSLVFSRRSDERAFDRWVPSEVSRRGFGDNRAPLRGSNGDRLVKLTSALISKSFFKLF